MLRFAHLTVVFYTYLSINTVVSNPKIVTSVCRISGSHLNKFMKLFTSYNYNQNTLHNYNAVLLF